MASIKKYFKWQKIGKSDSTAYLINSDTSHGSDCQSPDQGVWVFAVLDEGVHGHDGHVRLALGIVHLNKNKSYSLIRYNYQKRLVTGHSGSFDQKCNYQGSIS